MQRNEFSSEPDFSPGVWEAYCPDESPPVATIDIKYDDEGKLVGRCRRPIRVEERKGGKVRVKFKKDNWMYLGFFLNCTWRKVNS